jgi:hypothetical protein
MISGGFFEAFAVDCGCSVGLDSFFSEQLLQQSRQYTNTIDWFHFPE